MFDPDQSNLSFEEALHLLKEGDRIARAFWNNDTYLALIPEQISNSSTTKYPFYIAPNQQVAHVPVIAIFTGGDLIVGWIPNSLDLFANDWGVYL